MADYHLVECRGSHQDYTDSYNWCIERLGDPFDINGTWMPQHLKMAETNRKTIKWAFAFHDSDIALEFKLRWG